MKKTSLIYGAIIFSAFSLLAKLLGALYKIPLTSIIGAEGIGLYQSIFPLYGFIVALTSGGLTTAVASVVSTLTKEQSFESKALIKACITVFCLASAIPAIILALLSAPIARLQGNELIKNGYVIIAPSVIFATATAVLRGYFQGKHSFTPSAISSFAEQFFKLAVGLTLCYVFAKNNPTLGFILAAVSVTVAEILSTVVLLPFLGRRVKNQSFSTPVLVKPTVALIIKYAVPITVGGLVLPLTQFIESVMIIRILSQTVTTAQATAGYGLLTGVVGAVLSVPTAITCAVSAVFLPKISSCRDDKVKLEGHFSLGTRLFVTGGLIASSALFVFAEEAITLLFSSGLDESAIKTAVFLLKIGSVQVFYNCVLHVCAITIQGLGKPRVHTLTLLFSGIVKITACYLFTKLFGLNGAMLSQIIFYAISSLIELFLLLFKQKITPDFAFIPKTAVATAVFAFSASLLKALPVFSSLLGSVFAGVIALSLFAVTIFAASIIEQFRLNRKTTV